MFLYMCQIDLRYYLFFISNEGWDSTESCLGLWAKVHLKDCSVFVVLASF